MTAPSEANMTAKWAVAFDVDSIQDYVFASHRPTDVMGSSLIVEDLSDEFRHWAGSGVVFAGGGNGLALVDNEGEARRLADRIERYFARTTAGGATLSAVTVARQGSDEATWYQAQGALRLAKAERAFRQPTTLVSAGTEVADVCQACGREVVTCTDRLGDTEERIGDQCRHRRERGRATGAPADLEGLFDDSRGQLAAVYLDGDGVGQYLSKARSFVELGKLARDIRSATTAAIVGASNYLGLRTGQYLAPVVGGDDILVFVDGRRAGHLLQQLWGQLRDELPELRFSAAVVQGLRRSPLRVLLDEAHWALGKAKETALASGEPAAAVALIAGRRFAASSALLFGRPVRSSELEAIIELALVFAAVEPSQRAGMAAEVADDSAPRAVLNLEYRAARNGLVKKALDKAFCFVRAEGDGAEGDARLVATVAGALALADEWGQPVR